MINNVTNCFRRFFTLDGRGFSLLTEPFFIFSISLIAYLSRVAMARSSSRRVSLTFPDRGTLTCSFLFLNQQFGIASQLVRFYHYFTVNFIHRDFTVKNDFDENASTKETLDKRWKNIK